MIDSSRDQAPKAALSNSALALLGPWTGDGDGHIDR